MGDILGLFVHRKHPTYGKGDFCSIPLPQYILILSFLHKAYRSDTARIPEKQSHHKVIRTDSHDI
jgi:hypothetical protein